MLRKKPMLDPSDFKKKFFLKKSKLLHLMNSSNFTSKCIFCEKCPRSKDFLVMINKALYVKFAASQNYYYSKDVNEIFSTTRNKVSIQFKDQQAFDEEDEYLKRVYGSKETKGKVTILTEYYKYHRDVPRIFMYSIARIMNYYHDKKRKIEYIRITKIIKDKNEELKKNKTRTEKNLNQGVFVEEKTEKNTNINPPLKNNFLKILEDIDLTEEKQQTAFKNNELSGVSTVFELQKKLGDIINEKFSNDMNSELYTNEESFANKKFDNSSFLKFMSGVEEEEFDKKIQVLTKQKKDLQKLNFEKENTAVMKKKLYAKNFTSFAEKPNSAIDFKVKLTSDSLKQKELFIKENNSVRNSSIFSNNLKIELKNKFLPLKKNEKLLRKVSSNRKSADMNYIDKNKSLQKQTTPKNIINYNFDYCRTEGNDNDNKLEIKSSHVRIFSTIENSLQKANNYSKLRIMKNSSISKKIINIDSTKYTPMNLEEKKSFITKDSKKPNQQHKYTKSDLNGGNMMSIGSPKSNKDLKYFYHSKILSNFKCVGLKNLIVGHKKNPSESKNEDNLISPKLNKMAFESFKEKSMSIFNLF